jgi:hypothetical protein
MFAIDMGGLLFNSNEARANLASAMQTIMTNLYQSFPAANTGAVLSIQIMGFAGTPKLVPGLSWTSDTAAINAFVANIPKLDPPGETGACLYAAIVAASSALQSRLNSLTGLQTGGLIVLSGSADATCGTTLKQVETALSTSSFFFAANALITRSNDLNLPKLAGANYFTASSSSAIAAPLQAAAMSILNQYSGYYLLNFCTTATSDVNAITNLPSGITLTLTVTNEALLSCFDPSCYANRYTDLQGAAFTTAAGYNELALTVHYTTTGANLGRNPCCTTKSTTPLSMVSL